MKSVVPYYKRGTPYYTEAGGSYVVISSEGGEGKRGEGRLSW